MNNTSILMVVKTERMLTSVIQRTLKAAGTDGGHSPPRRISSTEDDDEGLNTQGIATLFVMITVLVIIVLFCCFSAPGIRSLCKRYVFKSCSYDDPDRDNASTAGRTESSSGAPTVILLSNGRMLVVDRNIFGRLRVDSTGLDFMELSSDVISAQRRVQRYLNNSSPSVDIFLDSDNTSKGITPTSLGYSPPMYEEVFGSKKDVDLPPSYSEVSFILKTQPNWGLPVLFNSNKTNDDFQIVQETNFISDRPINNASCNTFENVELVCSSEKVDRGGNDCDQSSDKIVSNNNLKKGATNTYNYHTL